jgi:hypothetical protein
VPRWLRTYDGRNRDWRSGSHAVAPLATMCRAVMRECVWPLAGGSGGYGLVAGWLQAELAGCPGGGTRARGAAGRGYGIGAEPSFSPVSRQKITASGSR